MLQPVEAQHHVAAALDDRRVHVDPGDAVLHIGRVGGLALLAVADDVDTARYLLRDDRRHRLGRLRLEGGLVDQRAGFARRDQVEHRFGARQAADMGRQDALGAELHGRFLPDWRPAAIRRALDDWL